MTKRLVLPSVAAAVLAMGTTVALAQSPGTTGTGSSATPDNNRTIDPLTGLTRPSEKATSKKTPSNQENSGQPPTTPTGPKNTPPYGHIEGGQPAAGGNSLNRGTSETQGADSRAARSIEGETRRGAAAVKPTPAEASGTVRSGGGSPPADSPVAKTNPAGGTK